MVAIDQFLEELCPWRDFTVFRTFFSLLIDIHLIFGTLLCHTKIQIKFEIGSDPLIFSQSYGPWTLYSFDIWYIGLQYQDTD
jgi:hypothetical protein